MSPSFRYRVNDTHASLVHTKEPSEASLAQSAVCRAHHGQQGKDDRIQLEGEVDRIAAALEMVVDAAFGKPQDGAAKGKENKERRDSTQDTAETLAARGPVIERTIEVAAKAVSLLVAGGRHRWRPIVSSRASSGTTITATRPGPATSSDSCAPVGENGPTVGDKGRRA